MTRNISISARLREVLLSGHWIANTNYKEQLQSLHWHQALEKVGSLNTIAALTYHINYYLAGLLEAFESGRLGISDRYSFDLPQIVSEEDWKKLLATFVENAEKFAAAIEQMDDSLFDQDFIEAQYGTYARNIEAVIEHSYYHLGQISLIKKMITQA